MDQIGRYKILNEIGRGAMGVVYRAEDPAIGRIIAIKTIRLNDLTDPEERERLRERLFREAQSAGILSHPNIVTIYDIAEENGQACIFMEYVNGPPLERLLAAKDPPDKNDYLAILRQTASALDYAHRKGIVHRDIKPANILIHEDGHAKVADFGVAKIVSQQMTHGGGMMGTPNYMSPEQVQGLAIDGRTDQFGLAVMGYEILTGEKPFTGDYLPTLLYKIVREEPLPPQRFNPSLGPHFENVVRKGLAKNPNDRYGSCTEFINALMEATKASPAWAPMPRGSSQSMATVAGGGLLAFGAREPAGAGHGAGLPPRPPREPASDRNPVIKSLIWVLVGLGLVGLVLLGAQRFLFNPPVVTTAEQSPSGSPPENETASNPNKPSPAPLPVPPEPPPSELPGDVGADTHDESAPPKQEKPAPAENAQAPAPIQKSGPQQDVQLLTDPPGATITVDNDSSKSCKSPCILPLGPGRHTLTTQLDGYRAYPRIFNVPGDSDLFLRLTRETGTLSITSNPPGATVQINGEQKSQKTPSTFALPPGNYHVRVTHNGVPVEFEVQLRDEDFQTRNVNFQ